MWVFVLQSDNLHGAKQPDLALTDQGQRKEIVARFLLITALPRSLVEACILRRRFPLKYWVLHFTNSQQSWIGLSYVWLWFVNENTKASYPKIYQGDLTAIRRVVKHIYQTVKYSAIICLGINLSRTLTYVLHWIITEGKGPKKSVTCN